jgi:uncharacterized membrane protein
MRQTGNQETRGGRRRSRAIRSTRLRLPVAVAAGLVAGIGIGSRFSLPFALLSGWVTGAVVADIWIWAMIWPLDARGTRSHVTEEDPGRRVAGLIAVLCSVASLGAIVFLLVQRAPNTRLISIEAGLCLLSVLVAWFTVPTVFTVRYAHLYYSAPVGGIEFHQSEPPRYSDFAYVAFTVGLSYAISDTDVGKSVIRRLALVQALISYLLGAVVIGATINLLVSLPG